MIYTADTGPGWSVGAFDPEADLVLSEATYLDGHVPVPIHLSAKQAGEAAREARAQRLILTHLWPQNDPDAVAKEGAEAYGGAVTLATSHLSTEV